METLFASLLCALVAAVVGYRIGRAKRTAVNTGVPSSPPKVPSADGSVEATAELHRIAASLDEFLGVAANPSELLGHPSFEQGVLLLRRPLWSADELLGYYTGSSAPLAFLALEALARREGDPDVRERVLAGINDYVPWTRFFALRVLAAHTPPDQAFVGKLLTRLDTTWAHPTNALILQEFLRTRAECGEKLVLGEAIERLGEERVQTLESILPRISPDLSTDLKVELDQWRSARIDRDFFNSVGRIWGEDEDETEGPILGHDALGRHVASLETSILARPSRSVLLVGEHGVGKTAIARALGERLVERGWIVFEAGHAELIAGMSYLGELEERLRELLQSLRGRPILWYVPDLPAVALAGRHRYGPLSALDTLLPYVERGEIVLLGEARPGPYERLIQAKPRVLTAIEVCRIEPLSDTSTLELVDRWATTHAAASDNSLPSRIRREAWQLAQQYLGDRAAPGNVLQLLDLTRMRLQTAGPEASLAIGADDLITTLTQLTGLPSTILDERRGLDLTGLRALFEQRVLGQSEAVDCLVERVAMIKAGVTDPTRPAGVFLFAGPTGTGKTEIAKTLAEFLFGSPERMIRLDMSEFQEPESLDRILGDTREEQRGGALVDRIRKQPFSVVLLDEFEKSHANVWDLFLQLFDDGRLTDRSGNTADFRNAIVIMTSNLGSVIPSGASLGFSDATGNFSVGAVLRDVERSFRKEFLNRIDRVVVFRPLGRETMRDILRKELADAFRRRGLRNRAWSVEWDESALELLLEQGFTTDLGARPLKRSIEQHLLASLALTIVDHSYPEGDQFLFVRAERGRIVVEFVDPDAQEPPAEEEDLAADEALRDAAAELSLARIALDPRGRPEEIAALLAAHERLSGIVDAAAWQQAKREGLERTGQPGFWESAERFAVLGHVEYLDRIQAGIQSAHSLLDRLRGSRDRGRERYPRDLVGRLAGQIRLLEAACDSVVTGEPREAFLLVEAWTDSGQTSRDSNLFARKIGGMYRAWSDKRLMQCEVLHESGSEHHVPYRLSLAVSGFAAWRLLAPETGLHLIEIPGGKGRRSFRRAAAYVRVAPQPESPPGSGPQAVLEQAREIFAEQNVTGVSVVRRYREEPSPLVRDGVRGWRTGRIGRVLDGDFDLFAERDPEEQQAARL